MSTTRTPSLSPHSTPRTVWFVTRIGLFLWAWAGLVWSPALEQPGVWRAFPQALWLDGWARWDSGWYESIGNHGYSYVAGQPSNVNFFPLFPALAHVCAWPLRPWLDARSAFFAAGWAVSNMACAFAFAGFARWSRHITDATSSARAVWLLALFPFSFFCSAVYTEGLFLALAVWAFAWAAERRWWPAAVCAALAAVTRIPGGLVGLGVGVAFLQARAWQGPDGRRHALTLLLIPIPLAILCAWHAVHFGDPLVFLHTQATWGRHFSIRHVIAGVVEIGRTTDPGIRGGLVVSLTSATLFALLTLRMAWLRRWPSLVYTALALVLAFGTGTDSGGRYLCVMFPAFVELGDVLHTRTRLTAWLLLTVPCLLWFTYSFCHFGAIF